MWTLFTDMHSGGKLKIGYPHICIEAEEDHAVQIFKKKFNRDPYNITCECCGDDFSVTEYDTLEEIQTWHNLYFKKDDLLILDSKNLLDIETNHFIEN